MNQSSNSYKGSAFINAISSVNKDVCFPKKVLIGPWEDYLFFEPMLMFQACFIEVTDMLLKTENASVIALVNLGGASSIDRSNPPAIFIEKDIDAKEYVSELEKTGDPIGWRFMMDHYVCASEKGGWCIYCERENDVAVFAFRKGFSQSTLLLVETLLKARSIRYPFTAENNQLFDFENLLPEWRITLVTEHTLPKVD